MKAIVSIYSTIIVLAVIGWIMNIVHIVNNFTTADVTGEMIVRIIGIFVAPIGMIMGWFW